MNGSRPETVATPRATPCCHCGIEQTPLRTRFIRNDETILWCSTPLENSITNFDLSGPPNSGNILPWWSKMGVSLSLPSPLSLPVAILSSLCGSPPKHRRWRPSTEQSGRPATKSAVTGSATDKNEQKWPAPLFPDVQRGE